MISAVPAPGLRGLGLVLAALAVFGCAPSDRPAIDNPGQLKSDCFALISASSTTSVDRSQWPASLQALHPVNVSRGPDYLIITTHAEVGVGAAGYLISHNKSLQIPGYTIGTTTDPEIFVYSL